MPNIAKEYLVLFNAITDAEEALRRLQAGLIAAQQQAEELFVEGMESADSGEGPLAPPGKAC